MTGAAAFFAILPPFLPGDNLYQAQRRMAGASAAAVKASGAPRVVMLSSLGADLSEGRGPIKGLHSLESILRESGAEFTAIRACYFQENTTAFIPAARQAGIYPNFFPSADFNRWPIRTLNCTPPSAPASSPRAAIESSPTPPSGSPAR